MKELTLLVHNPTGLHARPAKILANTAKKHKSDIVVFNGAKKANAKSMVSILTLGVEPGTTVRFEINGESKTWLTAASAKRRLLRSRQRRHRSPRGHSKPRRRRLPQRRSLSLTVKVT